MIVLARRFPSGGLVATWISVGLLIVAAGCSLPTKEDPSKPKDGGAGGAVATGAGGTSGSGGKLGGGGGSGGVAVGTGGVGGAGGKGGGAGKGGAAGAASSTGGAPGSCASSKECTQNALPICSSRACVACGADGECAARADGKPLCGAAGACVECKDDTACATKIATPVCFKDSGQCVACVDDKTCKTSVAPACDLTKHTCGKCATDKQCRDVDAKLPFCSATNGCVSCLVDKDCAGTTPICDVKTNTCVKCSDDSQCKAKGTTAATGPATTIAACLTTTGECVGCKTNDHCAAPTPGCSAANVCVACTDDSHCAGATPICDKTMNKCTACTTDAQCKAKTTLPQNPGICMGHTDGHCAVDVETIYVENKTGCTADASTAGAGTAVTPFCSMQPAIGLLNLAKPLIVVRGTVAGATTGLANSTRVLIVGQNTGFIGAVGDPTIKVVSGDVYLRDLKLQSAGGTACVANAGSILRLDHVTVSNSSGGGILLDGAAFDIRNTTVTGNGPGDDTGSAWGGIRIKSQPSAGPTRLERVTVQDNKQVGVSCTAALPSGSISGVLATGNSTPDITPTCGFASCGTASATCGAAP